MKGTRLKRLLIVILVAAAAWSGYWFVGSAGVRAGFEGWFADRRAEGWAADYSDLAVRGFPNRFDTTIDDIVLADPETGWAWEAPFFQLLALSYKPTSVIAVWPHEQSISTPFDKIAVTSQDLRASLTLDAAPRLPLDHATLVGSGLDFAGAERASVGTLRLATQRIEGTEAEYRYGVLAETVSLPAALVDRLSTGIALPGAVKKLELDMTVAYDRPWDMDALEVARPQPVQLDLDLAEAEWGELKLAATGEVEVDAAGLPIGTLSIKAERWRDMLRVAVSAGALPDGVARSAERALGFIANLSGNPNSLNVTLDLRDGGIYLGPVLLGPAPVMRLR